MDKENRQALLEKLLKKELEELRLKTYKYQRRTFLDHDIEICEADLTELNAAGLYETIPLSDNYKYKFKHKITISTETMDNYLKFDKKDYYFFGKKYYKNKLKETIHHELIHAFCYEKEVWDSSEIIQGLHRDSSPIFLSYLYWLGGQSNHECVRAFKRTVLYKKVMEFESFTKLNVYLTKLLFSYEKVARELQTVCNENKGVCNIFSFAHREAGLSNFLQTKEEILAIQNDSLKRMMIESNSFEVGYCIMPDQIKELVEKHRNTPFKKYEYEKSYMNLEEKTKKVIRTYSNLNQETTPKRLAN